MTEPQLLTMAATLVATLFGVLAAVIGWIGARMITRMDDVIDRLNKMAGDLHERINGIDRRVVRLETKQGDK